MSTPITSRERVDEVAVGDADAAADVQRGERRRVAHAPAREVDRARAFSAVKYSASWPEKATTFSSSSR